MFEYKILDYLRVRGFQCRRSYGSQGVCDIIAWKGDRVLGIQAKNLKSKNKAYLTPKDRTNLNSTLLEGTYNMNVYAGRNRTTLIKKKITEVLHIYNDGGIKIRKLDPKTNEWTDFKL
jgi:hypothetical protein